MHLYYVQIPSKYSGRLAFGPRPRSEAELSGFDLVVCLLTAPELHELELGWLRALHVPIEDRGCPTDQVRLDAALQDAKSALSRGKNVYIHCRAGIGRAALVTACLMRSLGCSGDLWAQLEQVRGLPVPDTEEQKDWVLRQYSPSPAPAAQSLEEALDLLSRQEP